MKNRFGKVLSTVMMVSVLILPNVAFAKDYLSETLTGTSSRSSDVKLGKGSRKLSGKGTYGKGTATAYEIVKWLPDKRKTSVSVTNGKTTTSKFTAKATTSSGVNQSYYAIFAGSNSKAKAVIKFTD